MAMIISNRAKKDTVQEKEKRVHEIEARNAFVLSHILGSEVRIENIVLPPVAEGNYNEDNLNINGLRFIVECQISEGGFEELKNRVEGKIGPHSFFFLDLAGETENFSKFFTLYQKHLRKEPVENKLLVAKEYLDKYGVKGADITSYYPFVEII